MSFKIWFTENTEEFAGVIDPNGKVIDIGHDTEHADYFMGVKTNPSFSDMSQEANQMLQQKINDGWTTYRYWGPQMGVTARLNPNNENAKWHFIDFLKSLNMPNAPLMVNSGRTTVSQFIATQDSGSHSNANHLRQQDLQLMHPYYAKKSFPFGDHTIR